MMPLSGVRMSWLMRLRKFDFAALARSASRLAANSASMRSRSSRSSSSTLRRPTTTPFSPFSSIPMT